MALHSENACNTTPPPQAEIFESPRDPKAPSANQFLYSFCAAEEGYQSMPFSTSNPTFLIITLFEQGWLVGAGEYLLHRLMLNGDALRLFKSPKKLASG